MRYTIVPVSNVRNLAEAGAALLNRSIGMPGMGLIWGPTGYGKTTATCWYITKCHGLYVRAMATWTPSTMLMSILKELDFEPAGRCSEMVDVIIDKLGSSGRPLFIDEADYIVGSKKMTETLRDIHDLSAVPVILIGMAGINRKLQKREQLTGRISESVQFMPLNTSDISSLSSTLCEVTVADDLLKKLLAVSRGSARLAVVGLSHIESFAKARSIEAVSLKDWGHRDFFYTKRNQKGKGDSQEEGVHNND